MRTITRVAAAALALGMLSGCDEHGITGLDQFAPSIVVSVVAQNDSVDVNEPMSVTVTAGDNLSLKNVLVVLDGVTLIDTTFTSATPQFTSTVEVPLAGVQSGTVFQLHGVAADGSGNVTVTNTISLVAYDVNAPIITITAPSDATIFRAGDSTTITIVATDSSGIARIGYQILQIGPTSTDTVQSDSIAVTGAPITATRSFATQIPITLTPGSYLIRGFARDVSQNGGLSAQTVSFSVADSGAIANDSIGPIVNQIVGRRLEVDDSVRVSANDLSGVTFVGFQLSLLSDSSIIRRDSVAFAGNRVSEAATLPLNLAALYAGEGIVVHGFAYDANGNIGYARPSGATPPATLLAARSDTTEIVFGRTFPLPDGGVAADIAVDPTHNRVYISNLTFDRLDIWEQVSQAFATKKVAVGSDPWGLFVDNSGDTLLVANAGGTNLSRVAIDFANVNSVSEIAARRIKTPNTYVADITASIDQAGTARFEIDYYDYSDRPQFVAQSANNDVYFSTKPTATAPDGTIRRFVAGPGPFHDVQQIFQYGTTEGTGHVAVINADEIFVRGGVAASDGDSLVICDHPLNQNPATTMVCVRGVDPQLIVDSLRQFHGSDASAIANLDVSSLGLSDTTFVAAGADGRWIAFGEGATEETGRVMMVQDGAAFFSPAILVSDLVNNASDRVFGLAINSNSSVAGVHGVESFLFEVESPFHLRLQGSVTTFSQGAGIAFHPNNIGDLSPTDARVAFVAASNGTIEIVDTFHYLKRGSLPVRANLYGPIRVTLPMPGDDPDVVLKLFGLTAEGMIVIDIRASDILPMP